MKQEIKERIFATVELFLGGICVFGFLLLLGTAGSVELNTISHEQGSMQMIIGLAMFAGGAYWGGFME